MYVPFLGNGTVILELLLNAGADLNATTAWGDTAAHYAALTGTMENLQFLVEAGISITQNKILQAETCFVSSNFDLPEVFYFLNLSIELCKMECDAFEFVLNSMPKQISKPKSYHLNTFKSYDFSQNFKVVAQKMSLPCP